MVLCFFAMPFASRAEEPGAANPAQPGTGSDTWAAVDGLGRPVADPAQSGPPKTDRTVGIFYFTWHRDFSKLYDVTKLLAASPDDPHWVNTVDRYWWSEPEFGYYHSSDPWVIRKHAQMLTDAGVDVIILDATNGVTYADSVSAIGEVYTQMRREGCRTPQFAFMVHSQPGATCRKLYNEIYGANRFPELWFRWQGKPLLLAAPKDVPEEMRNFFTLRESWAWTAASGWFGDGRDKWPWLDHSPQKYGWHEDAGKAEELTAAVAQHATTNIGRSFQHGQEPPATRQAPEKGIYFAEQLRRVPEVQPEFLFITGWNEWNASRFLAKEGEVSTFLGKVLKPGEGFWVDEFSQEYSRDIEPQRGHYEDNYYYQMVDAIRRYKGVRPAPAPSAERPIKNFADWQDVSPEYRDDPFDTVPRRFRSSVADQGVYTNGEGRNDIIRARVARDPGTVWFYVETRENLTPRDGKDWMQLLINSDARADTGWFGYDYVVNRQPGTSDAAVLEHFDKAANGWKPVGMVPLQMNRNSLYVAISRVAIKDFRGRLRFEFKWADNVPLATLHSPAEFLDHGDVAPDARFNYVFAEQD